MKHILEHGGKVPATPLMVAEYLAAFGGTLSAVTLAHRIVAINRAHADSGFNSPTKSALVKRTIQGIRRTHGVAQRQIRAITRDELCKLVRVIERQKQHKPLKAARDKALLLVGFAGAFRRSELAALCMEDVKPHANGIELLIRRSKTDQEGRGRLVFIPRSKSRLLCPVRALVQWLQHAGISAGPMFRKVNRHDQLVQVRLTSQSVALVVKQVVRAMAGNTAAQSVSGHSLRAGFVTEAAMRGLSYGAIMRQTGHRSLAMISRYTRPADLRNAKSLL